MWRRKYFPVSYVALVALCLSATAPAIDAGLSEREKSGWVVLGTVAAIVCDILEAVAIKWAITFPATTVRELFCLVVLRAMGIAKLLGKVGKVGGNINVNAAGEVAGEAVIIYSRYEVVVHSKPT